MIKIYNDYEESKNIIMPMDIVLAWWGEEIDGPFYSVRFFMDFDPNELDCKHIVVNSWKEIETIVNEK